MFLARQTGTILCLSALACLKSPYGPPSFLSVLVRSRTAAATTNPISSVHRPKKDGASAWNPYRRKPPVASANGLQEPISGAIGKAARKYQGNVGVIATKKTTSRSVVPRSWLVTSVAARRRVDNASATIATPTDPPKTAAIAGRSSPALPRRASQKTPSPLERPSSST